MVPPLCFYQLVLVALIWLCVMLQWAWPSDPATCSTTPEPAPPGPKRHRELTPFAALTTKQLVLCHAYHNFVCRMRACVCLWLHLYRPTARAPMWRPCTPARAAGLTDHAWTLREVLIFRVPPWPQPHVG